MSVAAFAELLERLVFTPGRNAKLALLRDWFATQPDPERGIGLAALTEELVFSAAKPAMIRDLAASRTDPVLLALSHDYVGDLAETVALIWPERQGVNAPPPLLSEVVEALEVTPKAELPALIAGWLDTLDSSGRLALIKLITGGLRVGVSGRLARVALADWSGQPVEALEELWHGIPPPYGPIFDWLEGRAADAGPARRPGLPPADAGPPAGGQGPRGAGPRRLAGRVEMGRHPRPAHRRPRRQADLEPRRRGHLRRLPGDPRRRWTSTPCWTASCWSSGTALVAPFADLQQRLNRKVAGPKLQKDHPAGVRLYDLLFDGGEDLRPLPFDAAARAAGGLGRRATPRRAWTSRRRSPSPPWPSSARCGTARGPPRSRG